MLLVNLSAEGGAFSQTSFTTRGLAKNSATGRAKNNSLGMAEDGANVQATYTLINESIAQFPPFL